VQGDSPRRLAAILMADIAGYTKLMGADEKGTHTRVLRLLRELVDPTIAEHRGRLVRTRGDGFLAVFDSPVEAVRCAIVIQQNMVGRNLELPKSQWIQYRIGVNLGDVIVEPDDIYGEGVNVAARLEQLAEPGTVYISGGIYEQVKYKLVCGYQSLGDRKVKNITEPVPIYRVLPDPAAVTRATRNRRVRLSALAILAITVCGIGGGYYVFRSQARQALIRSDLAPVGTANAPPSLPQPGAASLPPPSQALNPTMPGSTEPGAGEASDASRAIAPKPKAGSAAEPERPRPLAPEQQAAVVPRVELPAREGAPPPTEPEMIALKGGAFKMGSAGDRSEQPVHRVTVKPFFAAKYPVTVKDWRACVAAKACSYTASGDDETPVSNVSWDDTQQFTAWLSQVTGKQYRLFSEAEWEYAARAGTETAYWWGNTLKPGMAGCKGCGEPHHSREPAKVSSFPPNPFGLYAMGGGVAEWVADCWHKDYYGAPSDGSPWTMADCRDHVLRGGSWRDDPSYVRVASREYYDTGVRYPTHGFRVARSQ
jgi:formylglycine-generating enzyme required for sulfatase activity/class 3 adenylate cyclase